MSVLPFSKLAILLGGKRLYVARFGVKAASLNEKYFLVEKPFEKMSCLVHFLPLNKVGNLLHFF